MPTRSRTEKLCWNNFLCSHIRDFMHAEIVRRIPIFFRLETRSPWVPRRQSLERAQAIRKPSKPPIKMPDANAVLGYPVM